jgi:diguanylate cyclase (GGDEF)-like protein
MLHNDGDYGVGSLMPTTEPLTVSSPSPLADPGAGPRLLLVGEVGTRPEGLERMLVRAGFQVAEAALGPKLAAAPDVVLLTAAGAVDAAGALEILRLALPPGIPVVVTLEAPDDDAVVRLLEAGAADVIAGRPRPPELRARLLARVRDAREAGQAVVVGEQAARLFDAFLDVAVAFRSEEILHTLVRRLGETLGLSHCACIVVASGHAEGRIVAVCENPRVRDLPVRLDWYPEVEEAVHTGTTVFVPDVVGHPLFLRLRARLADGGDAPELRSAAAIPLLQHGQAIGAVVLRASGRNRLVPTQVAFAERLVQGTARVLETQERRAAQHRRQPSSDTADPLTGCSSLDALDRRLSSEFERARRYALHFSLVLLDVDGLAAVNAEHGMEVGDRVLADLGALLHSEIRGPDFVARYGGDEFALVLPETSLEGARRSVARLRSRLALHPLAGLPPAERPTLSAGIVSFPHPGAVTAEDLLALAETALIRAKSEAGERIGIAA